jgi:hypothetical protein
VPTAHCSLGAQVKKTLRSRPAGQGDANIIKVNTFFTYLEFTLHPAHTAMLAGYGTGQENRIKMIL